MSIGDTFVWCPPGTVKDHLWIVISNPNEHEGKCVVVNLTESSHGTYSFTLVTGQHRWIYKDSDVNFADAFQTATGHLEAQVKIGAAVPHDAMDVAITEEIIKKAKTHPAFPPVLRKLLPP